MIRFAAASWDSMFGWLANKPHPEGEGIQRSFEPTWTGPPWLTLLLLILLALFLFRVYRNEPLPNRWRWFTLAAIRFSVLGLVVFMLYGWVEHRHRTELPELVIAVDVSKSMAMVDAYRDARVDKAVREYFAADPSRFGQAKSLLTSSEWGWLESLKQHYRVKIVTIGDTVRELPPGDDGGYGVLESLNAADVKSRLGDAMREIIDRQRGRSTAAIVLLTDGITTDGVPLSEAAVYAQSKSLPLHLVGLGSEQPPRDVRLSDLLVDDVAFVGDVLSFDVQLHSVGIAGRQAVVQLLRDEATSPLAEVTVELPGDETPLAIRLPYRPLEEGEFDYTIKVTSYDDEPNHENNRLSRQISIRNSTIRVLLVQSAPSYEYRYLKSLLSRAIKQGTSDEKAISLTTVLQEADLDYISDEGMAVSAFPVQKDELFKYDVVIFGDANPAFFSHSVHENLREFVEERGGGVIFVAGPNYFPKQYEATPLAGLLPFDLTTASLPTEAELENNSFRLRPTTLGLDTPTFQIGDSPEESRRLWSQQPELRWLLEIADVNTTAMVLAEHPTRHTLSGRPLPVVLMQFVGAGKVIFHATDETYLWSRFQGSNRYYDRYWHQTIRYLSRAKLLSDRQPIAMTTDAQKYAEGDPVLLRVLFRDERLAPVDDHGVAVALEDEQGQRKSVVLSRTTTDRGLFETTLTDFAVGEYQVRLVAPTVSEQPAPLHFSVDSLRQEGSRLEMDAVDLKLAAATSGGRYYTIRDASRLLRSLPAGDQVRIESSDPRPIWNSAWLAALFVALLTTEWILRKRAGLL
ncbi:MAG: hypothetical protein H6823_06210 [Planctomycetaceae bacterium]|nr:hypothetical protein [Planctomycetaceae bacterium]